MRRTLASITERAATLQILPKRARKIICIETQKIYDSISSAEQEVNVDIISCLTGKYTNTAGGYHWSYVDDSDRIFQLQKYVGCEKSNYSRVREVVCAETGVIYKNIRDAKTVGGSTVWACLKGKNQTANGYHWYYKDDEKTAKDMYKYLGNPSQKQKIVICFETGKIFNNIKEAEKETGATTIKRCLENPKFTSGGYHWCTEEQYKNGFSPEQPENKNAKKVICIETNIIYNSMSEAESLFKSSGISGCVHDYSKTCGGYHWCLLEDYNNGLYIKKDKNKPWNCKKVRCIETNQIFDSANDAAKYVKCSTGNMNYALKDKKHKIKGYHWEYVE